jgi:hypothetical protein
MRNVEWPTNVRTTFVPPTGGVTSGCSICLGHGVRRDSNIRGAAVNGCSAGPEGLKNRRPSK